MFPVAISNTKNPRLMKLSGAGHKIYYLKVDCGGKLTVVSDTIIWVGKVGRNHAK